MKLLTTATATTAVIALLATTATASTIADPSALAASVNTFDLHARSLKKMDGKCTSSGGCKVPGGLHAAYPCWNSECLVPNHTTNAASKKEKDNGSGSGSGNHTSRANGWQKGDGGNDTGKNCTIAPGMDGAWVAKCPTNLLPYEWAWPWVPPPKKKTGDKDGKDKE
ncbi:hypothetical protein AYO21_05883 [Fonsecaea monophora]|uniref:Secreted protein n=1 Tax=Fonsecaea monophora TaxID=254056 RepID=A0A177F6H6_9EURO|nr:hypothetical protein AYO21_05883 [Fonsecaea monophora]KAH0845671.1 hypothetical protein FOPE_12574 [Fonsecaea pedrosoi]OAG39818.1 hypothetical protein AYO21_05883 [Fonsecaea monophora]